MDARRRLKSPYEQEKEQALVRAGTGAAIVAYAFWFQSVQPSQRALMTLAVATVFTVLSMALYGWIRKHPFTRPDRIYGSMVLDFSSLALFMHFAGPWGPALLFVAPFVSIGHAYRYGRSYLGWSVLGSLVGLTAVILTTPYWQSQPGLVAGSLLVAITIPLYGLRFLKQYEQALAEAEHASKAKSLFLAKMSHEFRTPLNGVIGMVREIKNDYLPMKQREKLQIVSLAAESLHDVVRDVLDFSKIESEGLAIDLQPYNLHGLLTATTAVLSSQARAKGLDLQCNVGASLPEWVIGDCRHLRQVLINLLGNAIKFTDAGTVALNVHENGDDIILSVEDTGIGIPLEAQKRVFDAFVQADDTITRRFGGTGLGLTISKQFVDAMGGTISVASSVGQGTRFTVSVPLVRTEKRQESDQNPLGFAMVGLKGELLERMETLLRRWGFEYTIMSVPDLLKRADDPSLRGILCVGEATVKPLLVEYPHWSERLDRIVPAILFTPPGAEPIQTQSLTLSWRLLSEDATDESVYKALHDSTDDKAALKQAHRPKIKGRILVVDDNEVNSQISRACLERAGWSVRQAANFDDACTALSEEVFAVAMFDMHMPDATGFDLLQEAQNMLAGGPVPGFVLCTADARLEVQEAAKKLGFDGVILKPITEQSIRTVVNKAARNLPNSSVVPLISRGAQHRPAVEDLLDPGRLAELRRMTPDFERFWTRITGDFVRDTDALVARLPQALASKDIQAWRDIVHAIKGNSINLGGHALYDACSRAHSMPRDEVLRDGARMGKTLSELYDATKQALHAAIDLAA